VCVCVCVCITERNTKMEERDAGNTEGEKRGAISKSQDRGQNLLLGEKTAL